VNSLSAQRLQHVLREGPTNPSAAMARRNGEVVKIAATAVVSSQDGAKQSAPFSSDEAGPGIAFEIVQHGLARVCASKGKAFGLPPQSHGVIVVRGLKWDDFRHFRDGRERLTDRG